MADTLRPITERQIRIGSMNINGYDRYKRNLGLFYTEMVADEIDILILQETHSLILNSDMNVCKGVELSQAVNPDAATEGVAILWSVCTWQMVKELVLCKDT